MSYLRDDATTFSHELVAGFVAANGRYVRAVDGGVVRSTPTAEGHVAVVVGGGTGHYPAFAGLVGPGLAHGAAMGNVFASPAAQQVEAVARAADHGGGVLLCYGNYAGDALNFDAAQASLRRAGIDCQTVRVTDDVWSASADDRSNRRGIAGGLAVFKVASAAAESGLALADVARVAARANERVRSVGVAFTGCTLPGAAEPLFTVAEGRMAVGLGIHGEPGIDERDRPSARELAALLLDRLLQELPEGIRTSRGARVVPVLNGLGAVKYEELFTVYGHLAEFLEQAGVAIVDPQVGEFVTSFDMAGLSLSLFWLDDELERLWLAPADTPTFRRVGGTAASASPPTERPSVLKQDVAGEDPSPATSASRQAAVGVARVLGVISATLNENVDELGRLDSVAGDGDHGIGMQRGAQAAHRSAADSLARHAGAGSTLARAGDAWALDAGGTSGALWGLALRACGEVLGDETVPTGESVSAGVAAARDAVVAAGKAELGDKTMVDALIPFSETLTLEVAGGADLGEAWSAAAAACSTAAARTADLLPLKGRARPHAEKSVGSPDPGAVSLALIVTAIAHELTERKHA